MHVPPEYSELLTITRLALENTPPPSGFTVEDWARLLKQAQEHGVTAYLYPWLMGVGSPLHARQDSATRHTLEAWRHHFLRNLARTTQQQHSLVRLLRTLHEHHIKVILLKGAWLGASLYDDPAQREMNDVDLLVKKDQLDLCHKLLLEMGCAVHTDRRHNCFAYEQVYRVPWLSCPLGVHWDFSCDLTPILPRPDLTAIWRQAHPEQWYGVPVQSFDIHDRLAHSIHHVLHHAFSMPLRGYLDIALMLLRHADSLDKTALAAATTHWKIGAGLSFVASFSASLLDIPLPVSLASPPGTHDPNLTHLASQALFNLTHANTLRGETTLLEFRDATTWGKIALLCKTLFKGRAYLEIHDPRVKSWRHLPLAWIRRARYLRQRYATRLARCEANPAESVAQTRHKLLQHLLSQPSFTPSPGGASPLHRSTHLINRRRNLHQ